MNKKQKRTRKTAAKPGRKKSSDKTATREKPNARLHYKDTMFRMLFREKENLLSLYNAVNRSSYTDVDNLEITTLENAVYTNYKNDVSFVFGFELMLYEHLRLSDAFLTQPENPELELSVTVYNINWGYNDDLMKACRLLAEYAQYVNQVRQFAEAMPFADAVEHAVDYCIRHDILADFLSKNRAEAIAVSIFEYDEEKHMKSERKEWREIGYQEGLAAGLEKGGDTLARLLQSLTAAGKTEEVNRVLLDSDYRKKLLEEYFQKENSPV